MKPLRLEWYLSSSIAGMRFPLHVDALVAYAITEARIRAGGASGPIRDLAKDLPLEKEIRGGLYCWKASAVLPQKILGYQTRLWTRKTDEYDYAQRMVSRQIHSKLHLPMRPYESIIETARGPMKNQYQLYTAKSVSHCVGYCIGDEDALIELLSPESGYITALGARTARAHGRILSFSIEEDEDALVMWEKRVMPWPKEGSIAIEAAHISPYWAAENRTTSYICPSLLG